jgi:hypothetical protein
LQLYHYLFLFSLLLKPFYVFSSGGLQISDLFFILSFILYVLFVGKGDKITIDKTDKWLLYFVFLIFGINLVYFLLYGRFEFIRASLYYVYNFLTVVFFRIYSEDERFLMNVGRVCKLNIVIQLLIYVLHIGRYYSENRYMGTFNDPNQMAFFVFMSLITALIISKIRHTNLHVLYHIIAIGLIFLTSSTGMLLGMAVFYAVSAALKLRILAQRSLNVRFILGTAALLMLALLFSSQIDDSLTKLSETSIIARVEQKLGRANGTAVGPTNLQDRGIDRLLIYPEKIIFGAGEGYHSRFDKSYSRNEVHSTLLSILFYYGIVPTLLFLFWCYKNIRALSVNNLAVVLALFVESLTLLNQRQPLFWMIFITLNILYQQELAAKKAIQSDTILTAGQWVNPMESNSLTGISEK